MNASSLHFSTIKRTNGHVKVVPSKTFKHETVKVSLSLLLFVTMYLLMIAASVWLFFLITPFHFNELHHPRTLMAEFTGLILFFLSLGLIYSLLKFMLLRNVVNRSGMVEITKEDEPKLFDFIKDITDEIRAPFPARIYLKAGMETVVFYNSNFLSIFMPVNFNLQIGLGMVNSLNTVEFKAVLARELAHFSRKNMGPARGVYLTNSIIYHMLYDDEGHDRTIRRWAFFDRIVFGYRFVTTWLVKNIQRLMQKCFVILNRRYMRLSREIEFHTDAVAAASAGSNNLISAFQQLVPGNLCYAKLLEFYDIWINESIKTDDIYPQHRELLKRFAMDNGLEWVNDEMVFDSIERLNITPRRVSIKDQWASHPCSLERIENVISMNTVKSEEHLSAWSLFGTPVVLQKAMTAKVYERIEFENEPHSIDTTTFCERIDAYFAKLKFDARYKGYFDTHDLVVFDPESVCGSVVAADDDVDLSDLAHLLTKENISLTKKEIGLQADILLLNDIVENKYDVKTFDFDGVKLRVAAATNVREKLTEALEKTTAVLSDLDKALFRFFYSKALAKGNQQSLILNYLGYVETNELDLKDLRLIEEMFDVVKPFYAEKLTVNEALALSEDVKQKAEEVKLRISASIENKEYVRFIKPASRVAFQAFFDENRPYFEEGLIREEVFSLLIEALNAFQETIVDHKHAVKNGLLDLQLSFFED